MSGLSAGFLFAEGRCTVALPQGATSGSQYCIFRGFERLFSPLLLPLSLLLQGPIRYEAKDNIISIQQDQNNLREEYFVLLQPTFVWLLPTVFRILPSVFWLLPTFVWLLPTFVWLLPTYVWLLPTFVWLLPTFV